MNTLEVGRRLGVTQTRIQQLINEGLLHATNISLGAERPRWNVTEEDISNFFKRRDQYLADVKRAKELHKQIIETKNEDEDLPLELEAQLTFMEMRIPSEE